MFRLAISKTFGLHLGMALMACLNASPLGGIFFALWSRTNFPSGWWPGFMHWWGGNFGTDHTNWQGLAFLWGFDITSAVILLLWILYEMIQAIRLSERSSRFA